METMLMLQAKYGQETEAISAKRAVGVTALEELEGLLRRHPVRVEPVGKGGIGLDFPERWYQQNQEAWRRITRLFWGEAFEPFVDKYGRQLPVRLSRPHGSFWR